MAIEGTEFDRKSLAVLTGRQHRHPHLQPPQRGPVYMRHDGPYLSRLAQSAGALRRLEERKCMGSNRLCAAWPIDNGADNVNNARGFTALPAVPEGLRELRRLCAVELP